MTCSYRFDDSTNSTYGDSRCWTGENTEDLIESCPSDFNFCATLVEVDWWNGKHNYFMTRECSQTNQPVNCMQGESALIRYKSCSTGCTTNGCNNNTDVFDKFRPETDSVTSCKSCYYAEYLNGTAQGDVNCSTYNDVSEVLCPVYASTSCYIDTSTFEDLSDGAYSDFPVAHKSRGCSPFSVGERQCDIVEHPDFKQNLCKETCSTDNCNVIEEPSE